MDLLAGLEVLLGSWGRGEGEERKRRKGERGERGGRKGLRGNTMCVLALPLFHTTLHPL